MGIIGNVFLFIELAGTVAFAIAGSLIAIDSEFDVFGVLVLGCCTATGGGILRDLLLGRTPPLIFENWIYAAVAGGASLLTFIAAYIFRNGNNPLHKERTAHIIDIVDAFGLGVFTMSGVFTAIDMGHADSGFLCVFIGTITGVGGGALRDVLARRVPFIFVRRIYALAAIAGALLGFEMFRFGASHVLSTVCPAVLIIIIRLLAMTLRWDMPKIVHTGDHGEKK